VQVDVGVKFEMVTHDLAIEFSSPALVPSEFEPFERLKETPSVHEAVHHVRRALSDTSSDQHLLHLHIAAERVALGETQERVQNRCHSCGHEWNGPPASRRAVRSLLAARGVAADDAKDAVTYRGRIAHGGGSRDFRFYERTTELAGAIEGAVVTTIADRTGVQVRRRHGVVVGPPMTLHTAVKGPDGTFVLASTKWVAPIRFPEIGDDVSGVEGKEVAGFPTNPNGMPRIDPTAWPD